MPPLDPLIVQFPAPPTHIPPPPPTPTSPNPPPSRPPSLPLPPVPGPSRILGQESFFLLSSSTRPRRASRISVASLDAPRSSADSADSTNAVSAPPRPTSHPNGPVDVFSLALDSDTSPMSSPPRRRDRECHHHANESISEIDVRDILAATAGYSDTEPDPPTSPTLQALTLAFPAPFEPPRSTPSPDIPSILSETPRPVRSRVNSAASSNHTARRRLSEHVRARAKSKPRPTEPPLPRARFNSLDRRSWIEHDEFGNPITFPLSESPISASNNNSNRSSLARSEKSDGQGGPQSMNPSGGDEMDDGHGSDSSLDLHTPLPHLLLKHGVLSPRSKLLSAPALSARTSIASVDSVKSTTTGLLKDERNTEHRRKRHRDGRLLRGGIGLTTGLGWSDSEDEDAPSALTRRISILNLTRRSSSATFSSSRLSSLSFTDSGLSHSLSTRSLASARGSSKLSHSTAFAPPSAYPQPTSRSLSRSLSSGTLVEQTITRLDQEFNSEPTNELDEWGVIDSSRWGNTSQTLPSHLGSTAAFRKSSPSGASSRGSTGSVNPGSVVGAAVGTDPGLRRQRNTSLTASLRRSGGIEVGIPEDKDGEEKEDLGILARAGRGLGSERSVQRTNSNGTSTGSSPSTASSRSIPLPITPREGDMDIGVGVNVLNGAVLSFVKEKALPPLPPSLRRVTKRADLSAAAAANVGVSTPGGEIALGRKMPMAASGLTSPTPRPLRLASSSSASSLRGDRPAVPVPPVTGIPSSSTIPSGICYRPKTPTAVVAENPEKPRPRTGTGMVYRSTTIGGPSKLRLPSTLGAAPPLRGLPTRNVTMPVPI